MSNMDRFIITNWCGVPKKFIRRADGTLAVDRFEEVRESGINLITAYDYGYETNCEVLAACEKLGLKVMQNDKRIDRALQEPENRRELLAAVVRDYAGYPALFGYHITDEPHSRLFADLGDVRAILAELDPVHEAYYNLFPNYASADMLGNPTYEDHLARFIEVVKPDILSYDHYHFIKGEPMENPDPGNERERRIYEAAFQKVERAGFFDNIEDALAICQKTQVPLMIIILLVEHGPYRNLTEAEIRWEVFNSLCYGVKRISYFTYWTPGVDRDEGDDYWHWQNGMIAKDGSRTEHYHQVARINRELQPIGDILLPHEIEAVFHFGKEPDGKVNYWSGAYGDVTAMAAERAVVGFYGGGYFLLANKDYEGPMTVTFSVTEGKRVSLFHPVSGRWQTVEPADGAYAVTLAAGDGALIRLD